MSRKILASIIGAIVMSTVATAGATPKVKNYRSWYSPPHAISAPELSLGGGAAAALLIGGALLVANGRRRKQS